MAASFQTVATGEITLVVTVNATGNPSSQGPCIWEVCPTAAQFYIDALLFGGGGSKCMNSFMGLPLHRDSSVKWQ